MKSLFIDCPTGLSGDMLLAGLFDLGVPIEIIESQLSLIGIGQPYSLRLKETHSNGIRGLRVDVDVLEEDPPHRLWRDIKDLIGNSKLDINVRNNSLKVFELLAEAESNVHGQDINEVHFHELGAVDTLVDVIGVCSAIDYLKVSQIVCAQPPAGHGMVETSHGFLPVPAPAVLQMAKMHNIRLGFGRNTPKGELTTPTGLALMICLADFFELPCSLDLITIGIGLGHRELDRPNFLRMCLLEGLAVKDLRQCNSEMKWQKLFSQEAWIDDSTPEDIAYFAEQLRGAGAIEVIANPIQMKKGRQGFSITALVYPDKVDLLRLKWFELGPTLGLREKSIGRWVLPRRIGICKTSLGEVKVKQVRRPGGNLTIKVEHDELVKLSLASGRSIEAIRSEVLCSESIFEFDEEWN